MADFESTFNLGAIGGYSAKEPEGQPFLPPSRGEKRKGEDGKEHTVYSGNGKDGKPLGPIYGLKLDKPLTRRVNNFGEPVGSLQFRSTKQDNVVVFDDLPEFPTREQVEAQVLGRVEEERAAAEEAGNPFDEPTDADIALRVKRRIAGLERAKFRVVSLQEVIEPSTISDLQADDATGMLVGAVLGLNKKTGRNFLLRYFPASAISDGSSPE